MLIFLISTPQVYTPLPPSPLPRDASQLASAAPHAPKRRGTGRHTSPPGCGPSHSPRTPPLSFPRNAQTARTACLRAHIWWSWHSGCERLPAMCWCGVVCCVVLCCVLCVVLRCVALCCVVLCCVVWCGVVWCGVVWCVVLCCVVLCCVVLCCCIVW